MKPLSTWNHRFTLTAVTLAVLLAANRNALTAEPTAPVAGGDPEAILATKPATGALPANYKPSESLAEIVKLAQSGVSEQVLLAYINNSGKAFNPTPEDIIFLNDLGVSEDVIKALINNKGSAPAARAPAPAQVPQPGPAAPPSVYAATPPEINGVVATPAPGYASPPAPTTTVIITQPSQVENVSYFYDSLSPYGNWVNIGTYGWCWQPTVAAVNTGWSPYMDRGRWIYSNHGWYWHSDYSWGWAPFHYGRWHRHGRIGWVWMPDNVWGPSWVSWRYNSSHCGWAPLPPAARYRPGFGFSYFDGHVSVGFEFGLSYHHYNFLPTSRFCDRTPRHHAVSHHETRNVYNNTTIINNYIVGNNNTVINQGVGRDRIVKVAHTPIQEVTIRDGGDRRGPGSNADRITRDNGRDTIYRPILSKVSTQRVADDLRRAQPGHVAPAAPKAIVRTAPPTGAPKATDPTSPKSPETVKAPAPAPANYGKTKGRVDDVRGNKPAPAPAVVTTPAPAPAPAAKAQPAPAPAPTPAISNKRLDQNRVNQLAEEARARARERDDAERRARSSQQAQPKINAPSAARPTPQAEAPRYQNPPAYQNRAPQAAPQPAPQAPQAPQVRTEPPRPSGPSQQYRTEPARPSGPPQQYRSEPARPAPAQVQPSKPSAPERSSRGESNRSEPSRGESNRSEPSRGESGRGGGKDKDK